MNAPMFLLLIFAVAGIYFGAKSSRGKEVIDNGLFAKIIAPLQGLFNDFYSNKGLTIDDIGDNYVRLNTIYQNLYGIKLEGYSNTPNFFDDVDIATFYRTYKNKPNAFFYYVILKDGFYHRQYIFSYNEILVKTIADKFNLDLLTGKELANVILDLYMQNNFYIKDKDVHRTISLNFNSRYEANSQIFQKVAKENIYQNLNKTDLYQSYKTIEGIEKTDIPRLLKMNFKGTIWTYFDIQQKQVENHLSRLINTSKWTGNKKGFVELKEAYDRGDLGLCIANSTAHFTEINESIIGNFGSSLKVDFLKKDILKKNTLQKTPLKFRDTEFDYLAPLEFISNYICSVQKKRVRNADFWGYDKNGGFVNYSFASENDNPHAFIIANTGAGKSFAMQKILTTMINLDFETGYARNLGKDKVLVRYYDIGFSNESLVKYLKTNSNNSIVHIESEFTNFSYNICNLDDTNNEVFEEDLVFIGDLANLILGSQQGTELLTLGEVTCFKAILREMYKTKEYQHYRVSDISNNKLRDSLIDKGYNKNFYLKDLDDDEYSFLKKPLLKDAIKKATIYSNNEQLSEEDRATYSRLVRKLTDIENLEYFSNFDTDNMKEADFLSMDLNNFKESSLFTPIFVAIFQKTYLKDRAYAIKRKREKLSVSKKMYIMEESANFFRVPYFVVLLEKLALEARKYGVHLILISQQLKHIPVGILKVVDTRIFLLSPDKKNDLIDEVKEYFNPNIDVIKRLEDTEKYELCIWYSKGVFNMKLDITKFEEELFTTNPDDLNKLALASKGVEDERV